MQQLLLRIQPAEGAQTLGKDGWRKAVSVEVEAAGASREDAKRLFHHAYDTEERGETGSINEMPGICFMATARWVGILATGAPHIALLRRHALDALNAATKRLGPCRVGQDAMQLGARTSERTFEYWIPSLALPRGRRTVEPSYVAGVVLRAMQAWADRHEVDVSFCAGDLMVASVREKAPILCESLACGNKWSRTQAEVSFYMPVKLEGIWFGGGLSSKGYSVIKTPWAKTYAEAMRRAA